MKLPAGTILAWDRAHSRDIEPVYAMVNRFGRSIVILSNYDRLPIGTDLPGYVHGSTVKVARNRIISDDEWPGELHAVLAAAALTGKSLI